MTSWKRNGWQFFRIFKKRTSSQGNLYPQPREWLRVNSHTRAMVTKRRFDRCPMHEPDLTNKEISRGSNDNP
ncbi:hypothetical protein Goari_022469 [Gossypium aridum]|uniref:Uncharacterized protein n=1 Tax=Gossypium aridum TaxID=34290 RepID=A0A7J8YS28_GOSAI|nr:hypothetical protein [Gossypium aridum]